MGVSLDRIRVLHVDDDANFAAMIADFLEQEDDRIEVQTVTSAAEALTRLAGEPYDCIVSDHAMPRQTGLEFLKDVRDMYPEIPFILYTGKGSEETASEAISAGVTDYFRKESDPSHYTILANRITNAVETYYAQRELAEQEQRLSLFFEQSPLGIIEWNTNFEIIRVNDAAEEILGYSTDELIGSSWERIVPEADHDTVANIISDLLENNGGYSSTNHNIRKNGEQIVCEWHNRVVTNDADDVIAVFSQFQDITERREYKQSLEQQNERLEQFASVVSHDLRNPLQVAEGRRELLEVDHNNEHLAAMARAHDRMEQLIDQLLTLARQGETVTEQEPVELSTIVDSCWQTVETAEADIIDNTDLTLSADRSRLAQLFENLFRNAIEHSGDNVTVRVGELDDGFYVADDGPGIPENDREQIFDVGYTTSTDGTGFGLAIVEEIVEAHGWEISVTESSTGGARVEVTDITSVVIQNI